MNEPNPKPDTNPHRDNNALLQKISELVPGVIYQFQQFPDGRSCFPYASEGIQTVYEVTPEQVRESAEAVFRVLHPDDFDAIVGSIQQSAATLAPWHCIYRVNLPGRGLRWLEGDAVPERQDDASIIWHGYIRDITKRKEDELALLRQERHFRSLIENSTDIIALLSPVGGLNYLSPSFGKVLGFAPTDWLGRSVFELIWPENQTAAETLFKKSLLAPGEAIPWQLRLRHADGKWRWLEGTGTNFISDPMVAGVVINCHDITERKLAEIALQETEARYRRAELGTRDGLWERNLVTGEVYCSPRWLEMLGYAAGDLSLHMDALEKLVHAEDAGRVWAAEEYSLQNDVHFDTEHRLLCKNGQYLWVRSRGEVARAADGTPVLLSGSMSDISQRRQAEAELQTERDRLRQMLDSMLGYVVLLSLEGLIVDLNQIPLTYMGLTREEVLGRKFADIGWLQPVDVPQIQAAIASAARGETVRGDCLAQFPRVGQREVEAIFYPLRDTAGRIINVVGFGVDITERKQAERRVLQLNRIYAVLSDINQNIVREKNPEAMLKAACRIAVEKGRFLMAWVGMLNTATQHLEAVASEGHVDGYLDHVKVNLQEESCLSGPAGRCLRSGEHAICNDLENDPHYLPWRDAAMRRGYRASGGFPLKVDGQTVGVFSLYANTPGFFDREELLLLDELAMDIGFALEVFNRDIERQRIKHELQESEARYKVIFDSAPDAVLLLAADGEAAGRILAANDLAAQMHGYLPGELVGQKISDLDTPEAAVQSPERLRRVAAGEALTFEVDHRRKDGTIFPIEVTAKQIVLNGQTCVLAFDRDISERKRAQEELRRLQRQHALILNSVAEGIHGIDLEGQIIFENVAAARMLGWEISDLLGRPAHATIHHSDADGTVNPLETCKIHMTLREGIAHRVSNEVFWRQDGTSFPVEYLTAPVRGEDGAIIGAVVTFSDISERKRLEEQLRQGQKMEAIGTLAGGIAHDFNNILAAMFGYTEILQQDLAENVSAQESLGEILKATRRAKDLVQQILTFSRRREQKRQTIRLDTVVKEAIKFLRASLPANITIQMDLADEVPAVLADATQIYQVTMNLGTNALHAMENRPGTLTVSLKSFRPDAEFLQANLEFKPGNYVQLAVRDTGCGMDAKTLARIFEPFFTTKPAGKGTGLGLAVVHGIVQSHEGILKVESQIGLGTTFRLFFPEQTAGIIAIDTGTSPIPLGHRQTILLVDDEPALTGMFERVLKRLNYQVVSTNSAPMAIRLCRENPAQFDLVITDLTMPEMNGLQVARQIKAIRPDLPVILISGFTSCLNPEDLREAGIWGQIEKPVTRPALAETIHRALATKGAGV